MEAIIRRIRDRSRKIKIICMLLSVITICAMVFLSYQAIEKFGNEQSSSNIGNVFFPDKASPDKIELSENAIKVDIKIDGSISTSTSTENIYHTIFRIFTRIAALGLPLMFFYFAFSAIRYLVKISMFWDSRADFLEIKMSYAEDTAPIIDFFDTNDILFSENLKRDVSVNDKGNFYSEIIEGLALAIKKYTEK